MLLQVPSFQCRFLSSPSLRYGPFLLQELTTSAGEDALEAMNTFVQRLLGVPDPTQLKVCLSSFSLCSIYGTWDWSTWAHPEKKSSFSQGSLFTWLCKHPVFELYNAEIICWGSAESSNRDNCSWVSKAFVLAHGGGLQHPQHWSSLWHGACAWLASKACWVASWWGYLKSLLYLHCSKQ